MTMQTLWVAVLVAGVVGAAFGGPLSYKQSGLADVMVCPDIDDPVGSLVSQAIYKLKPNISVGIPELQMPGADPLTVHAVAVKLNEVMMKITSEVTDVTVTGLTNFCFTELTIDMLDRLKTNFVQVMPEVVTTGQYKIDGLIGNIIPVHGAGAFTIKIYNITANGTLYTDNIDDHAVLTNLTMSLDLEKCIVDFENLMPNPDLTKQINKFIGNLVPKIFRDIEPMVMPNVLPGATDVVNQHLHLVTYERLLTILGLFG